ncbi:vacuolar ATPase assembly integral membrane protein vma21 [Dipodascopsis uninucleata]
MSSSSATSSSASSVKKEPIVSPEVVKALAMFTAAMVIIPLGSFYLTLHLFFNENRQWAGLVAAIMANVVVISYVIFAFREDGVYNKGLKEHLSGEETKKSQ